jgi:hypothetical protein
MSMVLLVTACLVLLVTVLFAVDRGIKAIIHYRRRRVMKKRLAAAKAKAEEKVEQQRLAARAREALTSVMPGIQMHKPRHVSDPSLSPSSSRYVGPDDHRVA